MSILPLSSVLTTGAPEADRALDVCVVSSEFLGPVKNGGIATATSGLIDQLVADGHRVTLLYTLVERGLPVSGEKPWADWVASLAASGVSLKHIQNKGNYRSWRRKSWHVMEFLALANYDLVYFNEHHGSGYYSICAKRSGIEPFKSQIQCVITHGSIEWVFDINDQYVSRPEDLEMMGLERRSVEWADYVISPSRYILEQYQRYGWAVPAASFHQPLPLFRNPTGEGTAIKTPIEEIVFFGRLETRKGLWLFCDALDLMPHALAGKRVTFLGRPTSESGLATSSLMLSRTHKWPASIRLLADFGHEQAIEYLRSSQCVAVMPSLADNSPCVVYECMENGIPFLSTLGSGAQELVLEADWQMAMVHPNAVELSARLTQILDGGLGVARPSFSPESNLKMWSSWHNHLAIEIGERKGNHNSEVAAPLDSKRAAFIAVDADCSISLLLRNLQSHMLRFGRDAAFGILTSRGGIVREVLQDLIPQSVCLLDPDEKEPLLDFVKARPLAFFCEAKSEISSMFLEKACRLLVDAAAVSCITADRQEQGGSAIMQSIPTGDVPAMSSLGHPLGSGIWGCSTTRTSASLDGLEFFDRRYDITSSAVELGQQLMGRCREGGQPIVFVPSLGGVRFRENARRASPPRASRAARLRSSAIGIADSHSGSSLGFAIARYGETKAPHFPIEGVEMLPARHPARSWMRRARFSARQLGSRLHWGDPGRR